MAFHGTDGDFTDAVFTQDGPVAKVRGTLPDDTVVEQINSQGKVAINNLDQVAFHGKVQSSHGRVNAVFTSDAIVAQEDVSLEDTITPQSINATGGVAINDFGEVAFHGRTGSTDAVLVGPAPLPPAVVPLAEGDVTSSE